MPCSAVQLIRRFPVDSSTLSTANYVIGQMSRAVSPFCTLCDKTGFLSGEGGTFAPPLDMLRILFYMSINYKSFIDAINGKLCLCETVPDSTKLGLMKGPKSKFAGGACPRTLLVCHMCSLGPRPKTNPSEGRFQYRMLYWKRYTCRMRSGARLPHVLHTDMYLPPLPLPQ